MSAADWGLLTLVCLAGALSPGPSLFFILGLRARHGRGAAAMAALGHGLGVGVYAAAAVFGLAVVVASLPGVSGALQLAGGLYLLWLAWGFWPRESASDERAEPTGSPPANAFIAGLLVALLNPKIIVFFAGIFAAVAPREALVWERVMMPVLASSIDAAWYALVGMSLPALAHWFARQSVQRWLAVLLGACGLVVAARVLLAP